MFWYSLFQSALLKVVWGKSSLNKRLTCSSPGNMFQSHFCQMYHILKTNVLSHVPINIVDFIISIVTVIYRSNKKFPNLNSQALREKRPDYISTWTHISSVWPVTMSTHAHYARLIWLTTRYFTGKINRVEFKIKIGVKMIPRSKWKTSTHLILPWLPLDAVRILV